MKELFYRLKGLFVKHKDGGVKGSAKKFGYDVKAESERVKREDGRY